MEWVILFGLMVAQWLVAALVAWSEHGAPALRSLRQLRRSRSGTGRDTR